jgi:hypothetical protein
MGRPVGDALKVGAGERADRENEREKADKERERADRGTIHLSTNRRRAGHNTQMCVCLERF